MKIFNKHWFKIMFLILIITGFLITSSYATVKVDHSKKSVTLSANLSDDSIVVQAKPANGNGNVMNKTQIWGDYGRGWFLIKDYNEKDENQSFTWDLTSIHNKNESYFGKTSNRYQFDDTDMFKIYVINTTNKDRAVELYKTFYLGSQKQDVQLIATNYEEEEYAPISYDFPVVVEQYNKQSDNKVELQLNVNDEDNPSDYSVKIIGDNYEEKVSEKDTKTGAFLWKPKESGTFYIAIYDAQSNEVLKRKVYVNSDNGEYLQLKGLTIGSNAKKGVYVRLTVDDTYPTGYDSKTINRSLKYKISEPQVWSRTIKDYGDVIRFNQDIGAYEINEVDDSFLLNSGIYNITSYIKTPHSIEYDDAISKTYRKSGVDNIEFQVTKNFSPMNSYRDGKYWIQPNKNNQLTFTFKVEDPNQSEVEYEYAFFLEDARGKRMVKEYTLFSNINQNIEFNWKPAEPGQYIVYARIRMATNEGLHINPLPNSYEKEIAFPIHIEQTNLNVYLTGVNIEGNEWKITNGVAEPKQNQTIKPLKSHELNIIEIAAAKQQGNEPKANKNNLMYKVYVGNKGCASLGNYTFSNVIPFYPKSTGEYRLIIMVKDVQSGSNEDKCEILVNVQ